MRLYVNRMRYLLPIRENSQQRWILLSSSWSASCLKYRFSTFLYFQCIRIFAFTNKYSYSFIKNIINPYLQDPVAKIRRFPSVDVWLSELHLRVDGFCITYRQYEIDRNLLIWRVDFLNSRGISCYLKFSISY